MGRSRRKPQDPISRIADLMVDSLFPARSVSITICSNGIRLGTVAGSKSLLFAVQKIAVQLEDIMGLIIILIVGALVGWVAGMIMRSGGGILFDIVVGIVGALIAGFLFGGGASIINAPLNLMAILYSLLGAIILLAIVKLIRRSSGGI